MQRLHARSVSSGAYGGILLVGILGVLCVPSAQALVLYDSLLQAPIDSVMIWDGHMYAQGFDVGAVPAGTMLENVMVGMHTGTTGLGTFSLSIYGDSGAGPGSPLTTLLGDSSPASAGTYTYTPSGAFVLSPDTTYYVVAAVNGGDGRYFWAYSDEIAPDVGTGLWADYFDGAGWSGIGGPQQPQLMRVNAATNIPEPGTAGLLLAGLAGLGMWARLRRRASATTQA